MRLHYLYKKVFAFALKRADTILQIVMKRADMIKNRENANANNNLHLHLKTGKSSQKSVFSIFFVRSIISALFMTAREL